jgi:hypothetical protein
LLKSLIPEKTSLPDERLPHPKLATGFADALTLVNLTTPPFWRSRAAFRDPMEAPARRAASYVPGPQKPISRSSPEPIFVIAAPANSPGAAVRRLNSPDAGAFPSKNR